MTPREEETDRREGVTMARKTKVRVTIEPGVVRSVDDSELEDLARQGLIHSSAREGYGTHEWRDEDDVEVDTKTAEAPASKADDKKGAK